MLHLQRKNIQNNSITIPHNSISIPHNSITINNSHTTKYTKRIVKNYAKCTVIPRGYTFRRSITSLLPFPHYSLHTHSYLVNIIHFHYLVIQSAKLRELPRMTF